MYKNAYTFPRSASQSTDAFREGMSGESQMKRNRRKWLIISLSLLMITAVVFFLYLLYDRVNSRDIPPVISLASDELHVSVNATDEDLLVGVSAMDAEDGDLSSRVIVESVSRFIDTGKSIITYAVIDSHNNVVTAARTLYYTDYVSPRFVLTGDLEFSYTSIIRPLDYIKAYDCIDGDITGRISMTLLDENDYITSIGRHNVEFRVTNSLGDVASLKTEIVVSDRTYTEQRMMPDIELSTYLIYISRGELVNPKDYVTSVTLQGREYTPEEYGLENIGVDLGDFDSSTAGLYRITVYSVFQDAYEGTTSMLVIVLPDDE